ncbi:hypothetical protein SKAU_G00379290 [Synaphobranchus kaupii]|uniref:Uncharacterized protein n=1 Tax=Synaphobranchus kaupii TaxID=118154 RepID=A0A9Q1EDH0_SYNKA|nr:hypothetical protein SKAU_G00379290 [Synaphobranchus kaupii]
MQLGILAFAAEPAADGENKTRGRVKINGRFSATDQRVSQGQLRPGPLGDRGTGRDGARGTVPYASKASRPHAAPPSPRERRDLTATGTCSCAPKHVQRVAALASFTHAKTKWRRPTAEIREGPPSSPVWAGSANEAPRCFLIRLGREFRSTWKSRACSGAKHIRSLPFQCKAQARHIYRTGGNFADDPFCPTVCRHASRPRVIYGIIACSGSAPAQSRLVLYKSLHQTGLLTAN